MKRRLSTGVLILALALSLPSITAAMDLAEDSRKGLRLTLYSNGIALVDDQRRWDLSKGINSLNILGISPMMIDGSARLTSKGKFTVSEQAYLGKNLSHQDLLLAHVGKDVKVAVLNPDTGEDTVVDAVLVSADPGIILRIDGQIETAPPGRIVFPGIPSDLRSEPVFRVSGQASVAGPADLDLIYLSNGFSRTANHTLTLNTDGQSMALQTWATLINTSGLSINDAVVQVVAGDVQRRSPQNLRPQRKEMRVMAAAPMMDAQSSAPVRQSVGGFHLYTLGGKIDLPDKSRKQVSLLRIVSLPAQRKLISEAHANPFSPVRGTPRPTHPIIQLSFSNDKSTGPGQPIPGGIARVYGKDAEGRAVFLGEDHLKDLPVGGRANISVGRSFDVTVTRAQTDYVKEGLGRNTFEMAYRISITNGGDKAQQVEVIEAMTGDWKILTESAPHTRANNRANWMVSVPAKGAREITYRVRTRR